MFCVLMQDWLLNYWFRGILTASFLPTIDHAKRLFNDLVQNGNNIFSALFTKRLRLSAVSITQLI